MRKEVRLTDPGQPWVVVEGVLLPTAPPRLIPGLGIADTLAHADVINHNSTLVQLAGNPYAARPSLHAADAARAATSSGSTSQPASCSRPRAAWHGRLEVSP